MTTIWHTHYDSPVGRLRLTSDGPHLTGLWFDAKGRAPGVDDAKHFGRVTAQLDEYFAGDREDFDLELEPEGSEFQLRVWTALRAIPYGSTTSYGEVARRIGQPSASRAVGLANGKNPIAIIVPCHRVIGADGSLTGYGGGLDRKRFLLALESGEQRLV